MKGLSLAYVARNLWARKFTTSLTVAGMGLVVFVFATVLMMAAGLRHTLGGTGSPSNVLIIRQGSQTEVQSTIDHDEANIIAALPGIATNAQGQPLASREALVLVNLPKKGSDRPSNVIVRGTTDDGINMRHKLHLVAGRQFRSGTSEIIVGAGVARGNTGTQIGDTLHFGLRDWTIVGIFDTGGSGFDAEIWGDSEQMMQAFRRVTFSSMVLHLRDKDSYDTFTKALATDPRLQVEAKRESDFYADQSRQLATFISVLGQAITLIFSIGAIIGAMITMYASVANRTREIGTLRALGFQRQNIVNAFLAEAVLLGLSAGVLGLFGASFMQLLEISTTNMQTFSEVIFTLIMTPAIAAEVLFFSLFMGVLGGFLPALRASRLEIVEALRSTN